jgi:hypothetical protein
MNETVIILVIFHLIFIETTNVKHSNKQQTIFKHNFDLNYPPIIEPISTTCSEPERKRRGI